MIKINIEVTSNNNVVIDLCINKAFKLIQNLQVEVMATRTDIHFYQPESEQWTKVGDLSNARQYCSCVVLPSGELLIARGQESSQ